MYRVDRDDDLISAMIPLFGAALIGQPLQPNYHEQLLPAVLLQRLLSELAI